MTILSDDLAAYDACSLVESVISGRVSSLDVVTAHFARIDRMNARVNALVTLDRTRALARAKQADLDLARGRVWGPLHGLPITVKDCLDTATVRTTSGHSGRFNHTPSEDAAVVSKLLESGAILLGKTNCATLCCDFQTDSELFGRTNNPHDLSLTAGGSSGGEAAAVASGMSPLGIGTDTGGSIRVPASFSGVVGYKSSLHAIPREGTFPLRSGDATIQDSLTVIGALARSVRDLVLFHQVVSVSQKPPLSTPDRRLSIACARLTALPYIDDEVSRIYVEYLDSLRQTGIDVIETSLPFELNAMQRLFELLSMYEFVPRESGKFSYDAFWAWVRMQSWFSGRRHYGYRKLKVQQEYAKAQFEEFLKSYDCLILPTTPVVAFPHQKRGRPITATRNGRVVRYRYLSACAAFTGLLNVLGSPSLSIPVGRTRAGLPVAVQIVGRHGQDAHLLRTAGTLCETLTPERSAQAENYSGIGHPRVAAV
jgi:amidase